MQMPRGVPGGMVRVRIERDIIRVEFIHSYHGKGVGCICRNPITYKNQGQASTIIYLTPCLSEGIDVLAILKRIRIERYFATFCRVFECAQ